MVYDIVKIHVLSPLQFQCFIPISILYLMWGNLIHDNGKASVMKRAGMILWVPSHPFSPHRGKCWNKIWPLSSPLCGEDWVASTFGITALKIKVFDFLFISVWDLSNISAQFLFFQGMPLYTACMCVPAITLKCGKATGPTNSQNFHWTEIWKHEEFLQCGLQISLFELDFSIQSSHHDSFSLVT